MSSPQEQNTTMGDLMFRKSTRMPSVGVQLAGGQLVPTKSWIGDACISCAVSSTGLPHHFSNSR